MTAETTTVTDNEVLGDLAGRDINKTYHAARETTAMTQLVEQYKLETAADRTLTVLIEKLSHFFDNSANTDVRGLEEKLNASGRSDLIGAALRRKQEASKSILRQQGSKSAQAIYTFLMAEIVVHFEQAVMPLIQEGASRAVVDEAMLEKVISPALKMLEENPLMMNKMDIQGLVYFLAGNCYIRWDPC